MAANTTPAGLGMRGKKLWRELMNAGVAFSAGDLVNAERACRTLDRIVRLDAILDGDSTEWVEFEEKHNESDRDRVTFRVVVNSALVEVRQQETNLRQLLASLRLPESEKAKRPQTRGGARGAYGPRGAATKPGGKPAAGVSSLDRFRQAATGA